jgi:hypothetical protein
MRSAPHDDTVDAGSLRDRLRHVYWIGGGSGAGKSTVARRIADEYGLRLYGTDEVMMDHQRRMTADEAPYLSMFIAMDMDERWVNRSARDMLDTFHWYHGEGFHLIVEDLLRLPAAPGVVVEGFRLLPHLVEPLLADPGHAMWLLPTPEFRQAVFHGRGGPAWSFLGKTSAPERALRNLLERDGLFTNRLASETGRCQLPSITVDPAMTEDDLVRRVAEGFGLGRAREIGARPA